MTAVNVGRDRPRRHCFTSSDAQNEGDVDGGSVFPFSM